ncbi:Hypothetical protein HVR_LOCUS960 [uncultured virus]|nr:Hypothetical protein HVR_LOCUS960 [uncultured virus]
MGVPMFLLNRTRKQFIDFHSSMLNEFDVAYCLSLFSWFIKSGKWSVKDEIVVKCVTAWEIDDGFFKGWIKVGDSEKTRLVLKNTNETELMVIRKISSETFENDREY